MRIVRGDFSDPRLVDYALPPDRDLFAEARAAELSRLSLETGSWDFFIPARALYASHCFQVCEAFEGYRSDPNSVFMPLSLAETP